MIIFFISFFQLAEITDLPYDETFATGPGVFTYLRALDALTTDTCTP